MMASQDVCQECHEHVATVTWMGDWAEIASDTGKRICECCCLQLQLEDARRAAGKILDLLTDLTRVKCEPVTREEGHDGT